MGVTVATTRVAANTGTGNQDITTADLGGLTPKAALLIGSNAITDGVAADHSVGSIGITDGTRHKCHGAQSEHGAATTNSGSRLDTDQVICFVNNNDETTIDGEASFVSFISNGIRVNWTNAPAAAYLVTVVFFAGTDLSAHVNDADLGDVLDNAVDVTDPGFEPDVVINFAVSKRGADNDTYGHWHIHSGVVYNDGAGGITQRGISYYDRSGFGSSRPTSMYRNDCGIFEVTSSATLDWKGVFSAFDANGFTITSATAGANNTHVNYLALNFGGAVNSWVGDYSTPTATGNDADTGPSFTPQFVLFGMSFAEAVNTGYTDNKAGTHGFAAFDADDEYATSWQWEDAAGPSNNQSISDNAVVELPDDDGTAGLTASFVSFDTNGWTLNYTAVEAAAKLFWALAIEEETAASAGSNPVSTLGIINLLLGED